MYKIVINLNRKKREILIYFMLFINKYSKTSSWNELNCDEMGWDERKEAKNLNLFFEFELKKERLLWEY